MSYVPDPTNVAQPLNTEKAASAAAEFRALKSYIAASIAKLGADNTFTERIGVGQAPSAGSRITANSTTYGTAGQSYTSFNTSTGNGEAIHYGATNGTDADWVGGVTQVGAALKYAFLKTTVAIPFNFGTTNAFRWQLTSGGHWIPFADNTYNAGDATLRMANVYAVNFWGTLQGNISGNAPTATKAITLAAFNNQAQGMGFNWNGQAGQPTWLWGGNDGVNMYVYNPSNFSVNFANSAGTATQVANSLTVSGSDLSMTGAFNGAAARTITVPAGRNGHGARTVSAAAPTGGNDGDIWYQT